MSQDPAILWRLSPEAVADTAMGEFFARMQKRYPDAGIDDYAALHRWSVESAEIFWGELLRFCELEFEGDPDLVIGPAGESPGARFFPNLRLNFAENLLRHARHRPESPAVISLSEAREPVRLTYADLEYLVANVAHSLQDMGVGPGDRVAGYVPNIYEAVVAMLAATSLGALWSSSSPDFGAQGAVGDFARQVPAVVGGPVRGRNRPASPAGHVDLAAGADVDLVTFLNTPT